MTALTLKKDLLYVVVFGPGYGESVLVRIPPDVWVVIDSCKINGETAATKFLRERCASWSAAILTHPHEDHAAGFGDILDFEGSGPVACTVPRVADPEKWTKSADAQAQSTSGRVEQALSSIESYWGKRPSSKWVPRRSSVREIGGASFEVLHPDQNTVDAGDPNRLSTGFRVKWKEVSLVLGADILNADWAAIGQIFSDLGEHTLLKVPHHGSQGALHSCFGAGSQNRIWVVTPFNKQKLPKTVGVDWCLNHVAELHLSGLPVAHSHQSTGGGTRITKANLESAIAAASSPSSGSFGGITTRKPAKTKAQAECYVAIGFDQAGVRQDLQHGSGAFVVVP